MPSPVASGPASPRRYPLSWRPGRASARRATRRSLPLAGHQVSDCRHSLDVTRYHQGSHRRPIRHNRTNQRERRPRYRGGEDGGKPEGAMLVAHRRGLRLRTLCHDAPSSAPASRLPFGSPRLLAHQQRGSVTSVPFVTRADVWCLVYPYPLHTRYTRQQHQASATAADSTPASQEDRMNRSASGSVRRARIRSAGDTAPDSAPLGKRRVPSCLEKREGSSPTGGAVAVGR